MTSEQFSSFQIGKMLNVSRQAVNQWIDKGYIQSYRTPGGHRRVRRADLMNFLKERNIPVPEVLLKSFSDNGHVRSRIMVIDDDQDYLALIQQAIITQLPKADVMLFSNGYDALMALGANPPDLLVLDLKMPNIDGFEICARLKSNARTQMLPIFVVSALDGGELRQRLESLGVTAFCTKSSSVLEIGTRIADLVRTRLSSSMN